MIFSSDVFLTAGYGLFLLVISVALEALVHFLDRIVRRAKTAGFHYHASMDAWECPQGQFLPLFAIDHRRRIALYKAHPHACNACAMKPSCTSSDEGRELFHPIDEEPGREVAAFQQAISFLLIVLAAMILIVEIIQHHAGPEIIILSSTLVCVILQGTRIAAQYLRAKEIVEQRAATMEDRNAI